MLAVQTIVSLSLIDLCRLTLQFEWPVLGRTSEVGSALKRSCFWATFS